MVFESIPEISRVLMTMPECSQDLNAAETKVSDGGADGLPCATGPGLYVSACSLKLPQFGHKQSVTSWQVLNTVYQVALSGPRYISRHDRLPHFSNTQ